MYKCPRCGALMDRIPFPRWLRPVRTFIFPHLKRMRCVGCGWRGFRR